MFSPMLAVDKLINTYRVEDILDKGEGGAAVIVVGVESRNTAGEVVLYNQASLFLVGQGGWGGQRSSQVVKPVMKPPAREPDSIVSFRLELASVLREQNVHIITTLKKSALQERGTKPETDFLGGVGKEKAKK